MASSFGETIIRGALAGGAATWLMDLVTTGLQQQQSAADAERERAARPNGQPAVENLVDRIAERLGLQLGARSRAAAASAVHYGLGVVPGALYAVAWNVVPGLAAGRGLAYGALLFAVNDELASTALGLAGPPSAYPLSSHLRGLVGHLVLGATTDLLIAVTSSHETQD